MTYNSSHDNDVKWGGAWINFAPEDVEFPEDTPLDQPLFEAEECN